MEYLEESSLLELLDLYMDMCEKQDEIICRLGRIVAKQAQDIQHYKNLFRIEEEEEEDREFELDKGIVKDVMQEYESMKLEP